MQAPTVLPASIIIPLLRQRDEWLRQAVLSALEQTTVCEVLVITSPDTPQPNRATLAGICAQHPQLRVVERESGMRFAAAMNLGIRLASAERVGFLLSDDWLDQRAVETCLRFGTDIVSTALTVYKEDGRTVLRHITPEYTRAEFDRRVSLADKAHYLSYFFLYQRQALLSVAGLDEGLGDSPGIDDFDLPWSLLERGASVTIVEQSLYNCRDHEGERLTTRVAGDMEATFLRILDKHNVQGELRARLLRENVPCFGRSLQAVYRDSASWPVRKLRELYRSLLPLATRRVIHDRYLSPLLHWKARR